MSELNPSQKRIAEQTEGMILVDAGPGTGKTHTIVDRYINIISKDNVSSKDVILLTFTKNSAAEMEERIKGKLAGTEYASEAKFLQTSTFDSFCYSVVMESPESISRFFGIKEKLTRGARLIENDTLNQSYFSDFMDRFLADYGDDYGDQAILASQMINEVYGMINRLMSRGVVPLSRGWFGGNEGAIIKGDVERVFDKLQDMNKVKEKDKYVLASDISKLSPEDYANFNQEIDPESLISEDILREVAEDDRSDLLNMIHDVYYEYIRRSVNDNRLTFGLVSSFAFVVLYSDHKTRERMACRYMMIDEFQDTNGNQLMIALMLLKEPNLCVVGDWKQGIYGFRYVSTDNILYFEKRANEMLNILNDDRERVPFKIPEVKGLSLDTNYRSSQLIIDAAYSGLYIPATSNEKLDVAQLNKDITPIKAGRTDIGEDTAIEFAAADSMDDEVQEVLFRIDNYVNSGKYIIHDNGCTRQPDFDDIAVLCRSTNMCRAINEAAANAGIPVFLQGDVEIMSSREGKLALAWLKYVNNRNDLWGLGAILADLKYPLSEIRVMTTGEYDRRKPIPEEIEEMRISLIKKKRRITDLITSIFSYYDLNNDITQTIISVISSSHRNSLLTISDVIRMIETDIDKNTSYSVDGLLDRKAVVIQTAHKSKGLEYPIVILAGVESSVFPHTKQDGYSYFFSDLTGIRCRKEICRFGTNYMKLTNSWKTELVKKTVDVDHSEERRVLFVALSRAKQYITVTAGPKGSSFFKTLSNNHNIRCIGKGKRISIHKKESSSSIPRPLIDKFEKRRTNIGVHDILRFNEDAAPEEGCDEICGKGMEYGTMIHDIAYSMALKQDIEDSYPEISAIKKVLETVSDADLLYPEKECSLPFNEYNATLRGVIDLLAVYPDHVVIHDYKTDVEKTYEDEYKVQLSIYAHAASEFYKLPAKCVIDYLSRGETMEFDPIDKSVIAQRVKEYTDL